MYDQPVEDPIEKMSEYEKKLFYTNKRKELIARKGRDRRHARNNCRPILANFFFHSSCDSRIKN